MAETREPVHVLIYGDSGSGKTTGASTFPKPMLVFMWDPHGKDTPYRKVGVSSDLGADQFGTPYREVYDPGNLGGDALIRIEYYHNPAPKNPRAYPTFLQRLESFDPVVEGWATVVFDSVTYMELSARKWDQYIVNPNTREPRQWFGASTNLLEEALMMQAGSWPVNVVVVAHVDEDKDEVHGTFVRSPKAPGRVRKGAPSGFSELYHASVGRDDKGEVFYYWQTRSDSVWNAASQVDAPNPVAPHYDALWVGAV
jgi:hypothetical protein